MTHNNTGSFSSDDVAGGNPGQDADESLLFLLIATAMYAENWDYGTQMVVGALITGISSGRIGLDGYDERLESAGARINEANKAGRWTQQVKNEVATALVVHAPAVVLEAMEHVAGLGGKTGEANSFIETVRRLTGAPEPVDGDAGRARPIIAAVSEKQVGYIQRWTAPTRAYADKMLQALIPEFIGVIEKASPPRGKGELAGIAGYIRKYKAIPFLINAPDDLLSITDKALFWFIPGVVIADHYFSWVAVSKNGFYTSDPDDAKCGIGLCPWDRAKELIFEEPEAGCRLLHLHIGEGTLTLAELLGEDKGSMLDVVKAIHEVYEPVIEASRGLPTWQHGAGGERYIPFDDMDDLLDEARWAQADRSSEETNDDLDGGTAQTETDPPGSLANRMQAICYLFIMAGLADGEFSDEEMADVVGTLQLWSSDTGSEYSSDDMVAAVAVFNDLDTARLRLDLLQEVVGWLGSSESPKWRWEIVNRLDDLIRADGVVQASELAFVKQIAKAWNVDFDFPSVGPLADLDVDDDEDDEDGDQAIGVPVVNDDTSISRVLHVSPDAPDMFLEVANAAHRGDSCIQTVREIFGWFGFQRRGVRALSLVQEEFAAACLTAFPDLANVAIEGQVEIRLTPGLEPGTCRVVRDSHQRTTRTEPPVGASAGDPHTIVIHAGIDAAFADAAASVLNNGRPITATAREILAWFGAQKRGAKVQAAILTAFEGAMLKTFPDFSDAPIDGMVEIRLADGVEAGTYRVERR